MENKTPYYIYGINGPVIHVRGGRSLPRMSLVYVGEQRLFGEVVSSAGDESVVQIYEDSGGLSAGEPVYPTMEPMSIRLGPGLVGGIFDGIGRPLAQIEAMAGDFIAKGINIGALDENRKWPVKMLVRNGDEVKGGQVFALTSESGMIEHRSMVPPAERRHNGRGPGRGVHGDGAAGLCGHGQGRETAPGAQPALAGAHAQALCRALAR